MRAFFCCRSLSFLFFPLSQLPFNSPSQADAAALERLYDSMALETETLGLDSGAIRSLWSFYRSVKEEDAAAGEEEGEEGRAASRKRRRKPSAKRYSEFSPPLAPAAIRLLLFFLDGEASDADPGVGLLRAAGDAAVKAALAELEELDREREQREENGATKENHRDSSGSPPFPFPSLASALHVTPGRHMTVFQASHPASIVPDSTSTSTSSAEEEGEGAKKEKGSEKKGNHDDGALVLLGAPPEGALAREVAAAREAALAVGAPPRLVPHKVFLARSGALLLTLTEEAAAAGGEKGEEREGEGGEGARGTRPLLSGGRVAALRREASLRMPRASKRQPAILHVTLGRLLAPLPSAEAAARVSKASEAAAKPFLLKAKETRQAWVPSALAHVVENTFASVDGDNVLLPFSS